MEKMKFVFDYSIHNQIFKEAKKIREIVFINEQKCTPEEEYDEYDQVSYHIVGFLNNEAICCARVFRKRDSNWYLGRIAVLKEFRGRNFGLNLMDYLFTFFTQNAQESKLFINAQTYALNFYKKLGFSSIGEKFIEANIEHLKMVKNFQD